MATPFMNLDLPVPTETLGPEYAVQNNEAFESIDAHDHSSGKGVKIKPGGMDINADLNFQENKAYNLEAVQLINLGSAITGASGAQSIQVVAGDLYYVNDGGTAVQLTDGGAIVSSPGQVQTLEYTTTSGDLTINPASTFVHISVDTSTGAHTITLPLAASVSAGRIYVIKDAAGEANVNEITVAVQGSDTIDDETEIIMDSADGAVMLISNGAASWEII